MCAIFEYSSFGVRDNASNCVVAIGRCALALPLSREQWKINHTMFDTGLLAPMYSWRRSRCPYCCLTTIFNPPIWALATCVGRLCRTVARVHVPPLPTTVVVWDAGYSETNYCILVGWLLILTSLHHLLRISHKITQE